MLLLRFSKLELEKRRGVPLRVHLRVQNFSNCISGSSKSCTRGSLNLEIGEGVHAEFPDRGSCHLPPILILGSQIWSAVCATTTFCGWGEAGDDMPTSHFGMEVKKSSIVYTPRMYYLILEMHWVWGLMTCNPISSPAYVRGSEISCMFCTSFIFDCTHGPHFSRYKGNALLLRYGGRGGVVKCYPAFPFFSI